MLRPNKNFIFSGGHCFSTIFVLTFYSLYTLGYATFHFTDVHIYRKLFLALKEVRMVKITPQNPPAKFLIPPPPIP